MGVRGVDIWRNKIYKGIYIPSSLQRLLKMAHMLRLHELRMLTEQRFVFCECCQRFEKIFEQVFIYSHRYPTILISA